MKKLGLSNPLLAPSCKDSLLLYKIWKAYISNLLLSCQTETQLQAKMSSADLIGAQVIIVDSTSTILKGLKGIISAQTKNCYYLSVLCNNNSDSKDNSNSNKDNINNSFSNNELNSIKSNIEISNLNDNNKQDQEKIDKRKMTVHRIIKETNVIAITLPKKNQMKTKKSNDNNISINDNRVCMIYGKHFLPHAKELEFL
jgi:hypothetical protein